MQTQTSPDHFHPLRRGVSSVRSMMLSLMGSCSAMGLRCDIDGIYGMFGHFFWFRPIALGTHKMHAPNTSGNRRSILPCLPCLPRLKAHGLPSLPFYRYNFTGIMRSLGSILDSGFTLPFVVLLPGAIQHPT